MVRFTKLLRVLLIVSLLFLLLVVYGVAKLQEVKHELGLTVDWQNLQIGIKGITFEKLIIDQQSSDGTLVSSIGQNVMLSFSTLTIQHLDVKIQSGDYITQTPEKASQFNLPSLLNNIHWAPHTIEITQFGLSMPCSAAYCNFSGNLQILQTPKAEKILTALATVNENEQVLAIKAELYRKTSQLKLALVANFNKEPLLDLNTQVDEEKLSQWQGTFNLYKTNNVSQLFSFTQYFLPNQHIFSEIPQDAEINADWQFNFPSGLTTFKPKTGYININASLPNRWPLINIGYLHGVLEAQIKIDESLPKIEKLNTDLTLTDLSPKLLEHIPKDFQPNAIHLILQPLVMSPSTSTDRALEVSLTTEGTLNTLFYAKVYINSTKPEISLMDANFQADTKRLTWTNYSVQNAQLLLPFSATITSQKTDAVLTPNFKAQQLQMNQEFSAKDVKLSSKAMKVEINYQDKNNLQWSLTTPITLTTSALTQSLLNTQSWKLTGQLDANTNNTLLTTKLSNSADLSADLTLTTDYNNQLTIKGKTPDLFFRTTNIFAKTFKDWPELLSIVTGKASINNATITIPFNSKPLSLDAKINMVGLSGIYDRSEFRDLSGSILINLNNNKLKLKTPDMALTEANPGLDMGPFQFNGEYNASIKKPLEGALTWTKAELTLFTGEVWLKPGELNLSKLPQEVNVQIKSLQLKDILKAYPTDGLNGEGVLDGYLPIIITKTGIDIKDGKLAACQAGYIKFNSPSIKAVGENNPNMKLVTEALENFQYTVLSSQISYDQGNAILGLQIKGKNPDIKGGQPINLNINLQENIPALMTTLQLSDRVNEVIQQRVQKRLQQKASKK